MNSELQKKLFLIPLMILIISGMQKGLAQDTLKVELITNTTIDVCGIEKRLTIEIQTNEIYAKDSLQGYTFFLEYDADKILIEQALTLNTITNQIVSAGGDVFFKLLEPGVYRAEAFLPFNSNVFLKGKIPLVVFSGKYIGQCEGIASIRITDFEPVFYSFGSSKILEYGTEKYVKGEVADISGRNFRISFASDSIEIGKQDSITESNISFQFQSDSKITGANINFSVGSTDLLNIESIDKIQDGIAIDTLIIEKDTTKIKVSFRQNFQTSMPALRMKLKSLKNDNFKSPITAKIIGINKCNCIKTTTGDILEVKKIKFDTTISVDIHENASTGFSLIESDDNIKLVSNELIKEITLYTILGIVLETNKIEYPSMEITLPQSRIPKGVYIIEAVTNAENKRNYIKFIK